MFDRGKVALATQPAGITDEKVNDTGLKLLDKYKDTIENPKRGKFLHEVYDVKRVTPDARVA
jgi:hypothetical protein